MRPSLAPTQRKKVLWYLEDRKLLWIERWLLGVWMLLFFVVVAVVCSDLVFGLSVGVERGF